MQAQDVMTADVVTVRPETAIHEVAELMLEHRISAVFVVNAESGLEGVVSEGDLLPRVEAQTGKRRSWWLDLLTSSEERAADYLRHHGRTAEDVMSAPAIGVQPTTPLAAVAELMERKGIKRVPVVEEDRLLGVVSRADLVRAVARSRAAPARTPADEQLRERVFEAFAQAGLGSGGLTVAVNDGVAELWGFVGSEKERKALEVAAAEIGAIRVDNHLAVRPDRLRAAY